MDAVFETINLSGLANFIEHEAVMLRNDFVHYEVLHHPKNREDALRRIDNLQNALAEAKQKIE